MSWEDGCLPQDLKDAKTPHLYKDKGHKSRCDNYSEVFPLSIAGKILCKVILNRFSTHLLNRKPMWYMHKQRYSWFDILICARHILGKCKE
jgi:hypothetical protein